MNRTGLLTGVFLTCCVLGFMAPRSPRHHVIAQTDEVQPGPIVTEEDLEELEAERRAEQEENDRRAEQEENDRQVALALDEGYRREAEAKAKAEAAEAAAAEAEAAAAAAAAKPVSASASTRSSKKPKQRWTKRQRNLAALGTMGLGALATGALAHSLKPSYGTTAWTKNQKPQDAVRLYGHIHHNTTPVERNVALNNLHYDRNFVPDGGIPAFGPELNPMGITPWKDYEEYPKGYNHGQGGIKPTVPVKLAGDNFDYATYFATPGTVGTTFTDPIVAANGYTHANTTVPVGATFAHPKYIAPGKKVVATNGYTYPNATVPVGATFAHPKYIAPGKKVVAPNGYSYPNATVPWYDTDRWR